MDEQHDPRETHADFTHGPAPGAYGAPEPGEELMEELRLAAGAENDQAVPRRSPEANPGHQPGHGETDLRGVPSAKFKADPGARPLQASPEIKMPAGPTPQAHTNAGSVHPSGASDTVGNMGLLMDVQLPVSIELGRTELSIQEILELRHGSIVELDRLAGEPVDIFVNGQLLAKGEVVVLDERFGVRITSLISERERLEHFGS